MFETNVVEKIKTHPVCSLPFLCVRCRRMFRDG